MSFSGQLHAATEKCREILDHLGAMYAISNVPEAPKDGGPRYTTDVLEFPFSGHDPIDLGDPYDPEGKGEHHFDDKNGLPSDGTIGGGRGSIPNEGLPSDSTSTGSPNDYGFGLGEGA